MPKTLKAINKSFVSLVENLNTMPFVYNSNICKFK